MRSAKRTQTDDGTVYCFSSHWINDLEAENRWRLYWQQQKLMDGLLEPGQSLLEIGLGNGFTADYLRSHKYTVTTLDIDAGKHPDIIANVAAYDFPDSFDSVLAFEVFEHIPYDKFAAVLERLTRTARRYVFLSLPRNELVPLRVSLKLGAWRREHTWEYRRLEGRIRDAHHHWELDHGETTLARTERLFARCGFSLVRHVKKGKYHFFALGAPRG